MIIGARESRGASEAVRVTLQRGGPGVGREGVVRALYAVSPRDWSSRSCHGAFEPGQQTTEVSASVDVRPQYAGVRSASNWCRLNRRESNKVTPHVADRSMCCNGFRQEVVCELVSLRYRPGKLRAAAASLKVPTG